MITTIAILQLYHVIPLYPILRCSHTAIFFYSQSIGETFTMNTMIDFGLCSHAHSARIRNWNFSLTIYWLTNLHSPLLYNGLGHIPRYKSSYWNTFFWTHKNWSFLVLNRPFRSLIISQHPNCSVDGDFKGWTWFFKQGMPMIDVG